MAIEIYNDFDLLNNQIKNHRLEQGHAGAKVKGSLWYNTTTNLPVFNDGTVDKDLTTSTVFVQTTAANTWGPIPNTRGRPCSVTVIDSAGTEFEADISNAADFSTVTISMAKAMSGKAILF